MSDYAKHWLSAEEFQLAKKILEREPNETELGMIGAMWSEHCSYKSSKVHLERFPKEGKRVLEGPGENAGVVEIGEGLACAFKIESHNHPSFIEPYQGAATGVGGILRDVFTMGARPIASLNSLRFGATSHPRTRHLLAGVVAGIGGYGNCIGVPTVGGECSFHPSYNGNILVNAFTLGIVSSKKYFKANASGVGNPVFYVGSRTGRDGIHGATMASESFDTNDPEAQEKRPTVQVGDPFTEKLLLEACLELMASDHIVGIQDMGAAGLTSSGFEMAGRGGTGVVLHLDKVPCREEGMTPYEIMLSESQERMLLITKKGSEIAVKAVYEKWGLEVSQVGEVTQDGCVTLMVDGKEVAKLPVSPLTENAPKYNRPLVKPGYLAEVAKFSIDFPSPPDMVEVLKQMVASPNLCSKAWIYEQYDQSVRTNTLQGPGGDAAVVRIKESREGRALAMSADVNPRYCYLDPFLGGEHTVAEATRNLACVGAEPIGLTDCLNFGNPENPEIMWQFSQAVDGIAKACRELSVPVVSGNVSLYNDTDGVAIYPTPTVVAVGLIPSVEKTCGIGFQAKEDVLVLLGDAPVQLEASEYLAWIHKQENGKPPTVDWQMEKAVQAVCRTAIGKGLLHSAHDCSDGGLLVALAECALASQDQSLGAEVFLRERHDPERPDVVWFGESASRILASVSKQNLSSLKDLAQKQGIALRVIGRVIPARLCFTDRQNTHEIELSKLFPLWRHALDRYMEGEDFHEAK